MIQENSFILESVHYHFVEGGMNAVKQTLGGGMHPPLNPGHLAGRYSPTYRPPERMRCMSSATVCI